MPVGKWVEMRPARPWVVVVVVALVVMLAEGAMVFAGAGGLVWRADACRPVHCVL